VLEASSFWSAVMIVFEGLNLLSRMAFYLAEQYSIDCRIMSGPHDYHPLSAHNQLVSNRWVFLNQYSGHYLRLDKNVGQKIIRLNTYTTSRGALFMGFQLQASELGIPYLGQICALSDIDKLYQPPTSAILSFDPSISSWCSHHLYRPPELCYRSVGSARQLILNTKGDHECAFQIFDWPLIMGFLPLNADKTVLVYSTTDAEKIDWPLSSDFLPWLCNLLKQTPLCVDTIDSIGPAVSLQSYHSSSYRYQSKGLFGEAAHKVHPLAGQGLNMGIADALFLLALSLKCSDHYDLISAFESKRWLKNAMIYHFTQEVAQSMTKWWFPGILRAFHRSLPLQKKVLSYGLQFYDKTIAPEFMF
jgi:hypothetical protein